MAKYDHTIIPLVESLAKLTTFLDTYSNFIAVYFPPTHLPQQHELLLCFRLRLSTNEDWVNSLPYIIRAKLLEKPEHAKQATHSGRRISINENDVLARRWQTHIEHLITFVLESPEGIRQDCAYRTLGGYLQAGQNENLLDKLRPQLADAFGDGKLPKEIDLFRKALPRGNDGTQ